jgi:hypothetical protein
MLGDGIIINHMFLMLVTMWGPRSIAKLVQKAPITMVYGTYNYSYGGL